MQISHWFALPVADKRGALLKLIAVLSANKVPNPTLVRRIVPMSNAIRSDYLAQLSASYSPTGRETAVSEGETSPGDTISGGGGEDSMDDIRYAEPQEKWKQVSANYAH